MCYAKGLIEGGLNIVTLDGCKDVLVKFGGPKKLKKVLQRR